MTNIIDVSVLNFAHGGGTCDADRACGEWDFTGLRRMMRGERWPDVLVVCEGERWGMTGERGAWAAANALRAEQRSLGLRERPYIPRCGTLTQGRGPIAPVIFVDPVTIAIQQWFDGRDADAYERTRNLLSFRPAGHERDQPGVRLIPQHFPWNKPLGRLLDAEELLRYGHPYGPPSLVLGDFNTAASGNDVTGWGEQNWWQSIRHGRAWAGEPEVYDTTPLDMLIGRWNDERGQRVGPHGHAPGFSDAAELAEDFTPTEAAKGTRVAQRNMRILLNSALRDRLVPGSYEVHRFLNDGEWDSDHKRVSAAVEVD